ncbi:acyl carrier protein [Vallitalea guaymasensis]|uniref:Acyl carrier protein n=1 Tax=Vallitalea guaymasensis TaxID=1185412 RepID=A0A8J8MBR0_9FIRM|nr:acyl carrier protein [Vallitalea guaymasensis]QUH29848.1 acyl carrier protein [Vallitalea guaymasensis]
MENMEIEKKVISIVEDYLDDENIEINKESNLRVDTGINSMVLISMILKFEDTFMITIDDDDIPKMITVNDIVTYIGEKLN